MMDLSNTYHAHHIQPFLQRCKSINISYPREQTEMSTPIFRHAPQVPHRTLSRFLSPVPATDTSFLSSCCCFPSQIDRSEDENNHLQRVSKVSIRQLLRNKSGSPPSRDSRSVSKSKKTAATTKTSIKILKKQHQKMSSAPIVEGHSVHSQDQQANHLQTGKPPSQLPSQLAGVKSADNLHSNNMIVGRCLVQTDDPFLASGVSPNKSVIEEEFDRIFQENNKNGSQTPEVPAHFDARKQLQSLKSEMSALNNFSFGKMQKKALLSKLKNCTSIAKLKESSHHMPSQQSKNSRHISLNSYEVEPARRGGELQRISEGPSMSGTNYFSSLKNITQKSGRMMVYKSQSQESIESMVLFTHRSIINNRPGTRSVFLHP